MLILEQIGEAVDVGVRWHCLPFPVAVPCGYLTRKWWALPPHTHIHREGPHNKEARPSRQIVLTDTGIHNQGHIRAMRTLTPLACLHCTEPLCVGMSWTRYLAWVLSKGL